MSWMLTAHGHEYHFNGHGLRPVCVEDIAHHLAIINRFHGATRRPYSVAEHSLLVCELAARSGAGTVMQLAALMHDAHEAYTNDLASPAKRGVDLQGKFPSWWAFEHEHGYHVQKHFGLLTVSRAAAEKIREWDLIALATERRDITAFDPAKHAPWAVLRDGQPDAITPADIDLSCYTRANKRWSHWRDTFLEKFEGLQHRLKTEQAKQAVTSAAESAV